MSGYYREKLHVNHFWELKLHLTLRSYFQTSTCDVKVIRFSLFFLKFKLELTQEIIQKYFLSHDQISETINKLSQVKVTVKDKFLYIDCFQN